MVEGPGMNIIFSFWKDVVMKKHGFLQLESKQFEKVA